MKMYSHSEQYYAMHVKIRSKKNLPHGRTSETLKPLAYLWLLKCNRNILTISRTWRSCNCLPCHSGITFNVKRKKSCCNIWNCINNDNKLHELPLNAKNIDKRIKTKQFQFGFPLRAIGFCMIGRWLLSCIRIHVSLRVYFKVPATTKEHLRYPKDEMHNFSEKNTINHNIHSWNFFAMI